MISDVSKTQLRKLVNKLTNKAMHRSHYLKWALGTDGDWSVRYFFHFANKPEFNQKYVLKSHVSKVYIILTQSEALDYILFKSDCANPTEYFSVREGGRYRRLLINHETLQSTSILE